MFFLCFPAFLFVDSPHPIVREGFTQVSCFLKKNQSFYLANLTILEESQTGLGFESVM